MGSGLGCSYLGEMYEEGKGVSKDYTKAKKFYKKACDMGEGVGCYNLGKMYEKGKGVTKDYTKAKKFYKKASNLGYIGDILDGVSESK